MIEVGFEFIRGVMLGIEIPTELPEDVNWCVVVDLAILRIQFVGWAKAPE